ncbi:hypothetical protein HDZ31DRAFT_63685 [Schizophyllum fasciatum]
MSSARLLESEFDAPKRRLPPSLAVLLVILGLSGAYGGWRIYQILTLWPPEVRGDLRSAVRAKHDGDLELSEQHFIRAWQTARTLPLEAFADDPYLKLTGIPIALSDVLETEGKVGAAYEVLSEAYASLQEPAARGALSGPERIRAVALAHKLGALAEALHKAPEEQEKWLTDAVTVLLKTVLPVKREDETPKEHPSLAQLELPSWVRKDDVGAPLEALGAFYARTGKIDFAMPLYLQAISVLIPPPPEKAPAADRCRGAQFMTNLADLIIKTGPAKNPDQLHQAQAWAQKALAVVEDARKTSKVEEPLCETALAVVFFNLAVLLQIGGNLKDARRLYTYSLKQSKYAGLDEGVSEAAMALRQLDGKSE